MNLHTVSGSIISHPTTLQSLGKMGGSVGISLAISGLFFVLVATNASTKGLHKSQIKPLLASYISACLVAFALQRAITKIFDRYI